MIMFNFREFESRIKRELVKSGYKPPTVIRKRMTEDDEFDLKMAQDDLSKSCA